MANPNKPYGLKPWGPAAVNKFKPDGYRVDSANTPVLCQGDPCIMENDGSISRALATNTNIVGVFKGCWYTGADGRLVYATRLPTLTASTAVELWDDPDQVFTIQCSDDAAADFALADVGNNVDFEPATDIDGTAVGTGGHSVYEVDMDSATANTAQLKLLGLAPIPGNAAGEDWSQVLVKIQEHMYSVSGGDAGI